jgi:hypothetical protein
VAEKQIRSACATEQGDEARRKKGFERGSYGWGLVGRNGGESVEEGENKVVCGICGKDIRCLGGSLMPVP